MILIANKTNSLSHTKWLWKNHIVFSLKYRRKIIYNQYRRSLGEILRQLCNYKGVGDTRRAFNVRSRTYVGEYTTETKYIKFYGIFKWKDIL